MTTKEELKKMIGDLYEQTKKINISAEILKDDIRMLNDAVKNLESEQKYGRWKPKVNEIYWYIMGNGVIYKCDCYIDDIVDKDRYLLGNVYQTKEQAFQALERLKIRTQLEDIALRLNKGQKITFGIDEEYKYYLQFAFDRSAINQCETRYLKSQDVIYCLDNNFKDVAISEIGEERLARYLKGE